MGNLPNNHPKKKKKKKKKKGLLNNDKNSLFIIRFLSFSFFLFLKG
jgi:uncharacterized protein Veg